jgi:hypothetical protein
MAAKSKGNLISEGMKSMTPICPKSPLQNDPELSQLQQQYLSGEIGLNAYLKYKNRLLRAPAKKMKNILQLSSNDSSPFHHSMSKSG